jgi:hypothetical protein
MAPPGVYVHWFGCRVESGTIPGQVVLVVVLTHTPGPGRNTVAATQ